MSWLPAPDDGRLKRTKGIGDRTYQVIEQALGGAVPDYLADLRQRGAHPLAEGGDELGALLRGDLHSHSDWSDGGSPVELMAQAARTLGREYLALTDHSPNLKVANGLSGERLAEQIQLVERLNSDADDLRILTGIEVDILENGDLDQTPEMLDRLDVVVASVHSKLRSEQATMTERMLAGIRNPHTNVLGPLHGPAGVRIPRHAPAVRVRRRAGLRRLRREQRGGGDQFPAGAAGPAGRPDPAGPGGRMPVQHRHGRARPRPAGLPAVRRRPRRGERRSAGADHHDLAAGQAPGLGEAVTTSARPRAATPV